MSKKLSLEFIERDLENILNSIDESREQLMNFVVGYDEISESILHTKDELNQIRQKLGTVTNKSKDGWDRAKATKEMKDCIGQLDLFKDEKFDQ